ncbi:cytochrome c and c1 heme-lyase [Auriculariales sp. MPI-PUGE-AT-0066]|nr:cytochrome c and c1 heme-lyase [Auriculariales sp. MPI-PUGE-AT-0066]
MGQTVSSQASTVQHVVAPEATSSSATGPAKCPIDHSAMSKPAAAAPAPAECPIDHSKLNNIPVLSVEAQPGQKIPLPIEREVSTIPRDAGAAWEYPSPQQFYNALVRKGWETPEEHVETMVQIHNFLNEEAWQQVLTWEQRRSADDAKNLELSKFQGKPGQLSPKARLFLLAGWFFPSKFNTEPPFDRHDWIVKRPRTGEQVRYVIDYYSAPPEPDGSPVFSLDVRPALDSVDSIKQRITVATSEVWQSMRERDAASSRPEPTSR